MKRDLDIMRNLLLKAVGADTPRWITLGELPDDEIAGHLMLLEDEGLLVRHPKIIDRLRATAAGHDVAEQVADKARWGEMKKRALNPFSTRWPATRMPGHAPRGSRLVNNQLTRPATLVWGRPGRPRPISRKKRYCGGAPPAGLRDKFYVGGEIRFRNLEPSQLTDDVFIT